MRFLVQPFDPSAASFGDDPLKGHLCQDEQNTGIIGPSEFLLYHGAQVRGRRKIGQHKVASRL